MAGNIVVLSGPVSVGKTTMARKLAEEFGLELFKTRDYLRFLAERKGIESERGALQEFGDYQDRKTNGRWVCDGLEKFWRDKHIDLDKKSVIVDAIRIKEQIKCIRKGFGSKVVHIHLRAPREQLEKRYKARPHEGIKEFKSYDEVQQNKTEQNVTSLALTADIVIDTSQCRLEDVVIKTAGKLRLFGRQCERLVDVLIGGQYGSEGKGHIASYLGSEYDLLVRVGGPNAGHSIFGTPKTVVHHIPSGAIKSESKILIGPGATIYVPDLLKEIAGLSIGCDRLSIDPQTMVITQTDRF